MQIGQVVKMLHTHMPNKITYFTKKKPSREKNIRDFADFEANSRNLIPEKILNCVYQECLFPQNILEEL